MGQNQYLRQNFSIGKQMPAKSGNIQEMENVLGVGRGEVVGVFFPFLKFFIYFYSGLVGFVGLFVGWVFLTAFKFFR